MGNTQIPDNYGTFSGGDMVAFAVFPDSTPISLGEITTFSYSTYREQIPVRTLGRVSTKGYGKGSRTVAGTMVFTVYHKHIVNKIRDHAKHLNIQRLKTDELPPFDVIIVFGNEYGASARIVIYGISVVDEGGVFSVEDMYSENTMSYVARDIDLMDGPAGATAESRAIPASTSKIVDWAATFSPDPNSFEAIPVVRTIYRNPNPPPGGQYILPDPGRVYVAADGMGDINAFNMSRINVKVAGDKGVPIENATVKILNHIAKRGEFIQSTTDKAGAGVLVFDPGNISTYQLRITASGHEDLVQQIIITQGRTIDITIRLTPVITAVSRRLYRVESLTPGSQQTTEIARGGTLPSIGIRCFNENDEVLQDIDVEFVYTLAGISHHELNSLGFPRSLRGTIRKVKTDASGVAAVDGLLHTTTSGGRRLSYTTLYPGTQITITAFVRQRAGLLGSSSVNMQKFWRFIIR